VDDNPPMQFHQVFQLIYVPNSKTYYMYALHFLVELDAAALKSLNHRQNDIFRLILN
jgi:hypothetical protein